MKKSNKTKQNSLLPMLTARAHAETIWDATDRGWKLSKRNCNK